MDLSKHYQARMLRLSKEGAWILLGAIVSAAGSLLLVRVLTEYLAPAEYGRLTLSLTLGVLVCQVSFAGSMPGIMRFYPLAAEKGEVGAYLQASRQMFLRSASAALVLTPPLFVVLLATGRPALKWLALIAVGFTILSSLNASFNMIQNGARQRHVVALHGALDSLLKIFFVILLIIYVGVGAEYVIAGYVMSILVVLASQTIFLRRLITSNTPGAPECARWRHEIWNFSKPFVIFNVFSWLQASSDRWSLEIFAGATEVGLYATLLQLGWAPIAMLTGLATTLIGPILFWRSGDAQDSLRNQGVHRLSWRLTHMVLGLAALGFVFTWLFHSLIFHYLVAAQYRGVSHLLPFMVLAGGLFAASQVLNLKMMSDCKTQALTFPKVATSLLGVAFSVGGAYLNGVTGVVGGMVCFSLAVFLWFAALTR